MNIQTEVIIYRIGIGASANFEIYNTNYGRTDLLITQSTGDATFAGDVSLANLKSIYLGTSSALRIYTDSATAYLRGDDVRLTNAANDSIVRVNGDVAELYYNDLKKFETTSTGVTVTGDVISNAIVQANGFRTTSGSTDYSLLTRNSSNTAVYIQQAGSGDILDVRYGSQAAGQGTSAFAVNSSGNATFAGAVDVTGVITADGGLNLNDNDKIKLGDIRRPSNLPRWKQQLYKRHRGQGTLRYLQTV